MPSNGEWDVKEQHYAENGDAYAGTERDRLCHARSLSRWLAAVRAPADAELEGLA